jgi:hypothetical protein
MTKIVNIPSQIVVQTAAQWAVDATVYSNKRILVTSDEYYGSTDQRKFKIADGTQTWAQLDYFPLDVALGLTLAQVLANGNETNQLSLNSNSGESQLHLLNAFASFGWFGAKEGSVLANNNSTIIYHDDLVELNATSVTKNGSEVITSANITQTITNGVTDKAPSEDAVYDALALKSNLTDTKLLFQGAFLSTSLGDSVTYYFSNMNGLAATGTQSFSKFGFHANRKITNVVLTCSQNVNYSNESVSLYLRKNATTDSTITTSLDLSTVGLNTSKVFYYTVDIDVTTGDDYEFKITTPAFATNGTNSRWHIELYGY